MGKNYQNTTGVYNILGLDYLISHEACEQALIVNTVIVIHVDFLYEFLKSSW